MSWTEGVGTYDVLWNVFCVTVGICEGGAQGSAWCLECFPPHCSVFIKPTSVMLTEVSAGYFKSSTTRLTNVLRDVSHCKHQLWLSVETWPCVDQGSGSWLDSVGVFKEETGDTEWTFIAYTLSPLGQRQRLKSSCKYTHHTIITQM